MLRSLVGAVAGLAYWVVMAMPALLLAGPGGGPPTWPAPIVVSLPGLLLLPVTGILLSIPRDSGITTLVWKAWVARVLLWFVIGLDAVVAADIGGLLSDVRVYRAEFLGFLLVCGIPWLALWVFWHYAVIRIATTHPTSPTLWP